MIRTKPVAENRFAEEPDFPLPLLQQPGLLLVGIDPETHEVLVWSGKPSDGGQYRRPGGGHSRDRRGPGGM